MLNDLVALLFPEVCTTCGTTLLREEDVICTHCRYDLPFTRFGDQKDNPVSKIFWGRCDIEWATAPFYYERKSIIQDLIHQLKYRGSAEVGLTLGRILGQELVNNNMANHDVIVPVPLHPSRQKSRGYNQAEVIAKGIAEITGKPVRNNVLKRNSATETQTKKSRISRWKNVGEIFQIQDGEAIKNQRTLLVDDVITTGATIESCATKLLSIKGVKLQVATLAFAS